MNLRTASPRRPGARRAALATLAIASLFTATACSSNLSGESSEESFVVLNWKGYGSDLDWATKQFQEETGAKVVHRYISSETELIELLRQNGDEIDVALPNFQFIGPAVREDLVQPLDVDKLEHFDDVHPALAENPAFRDGDELYGIPWVWGYSSIFYNTDVVGEEPATVADLWDPKYQGKVAMVDDATLNVLLASLYLGEDPADPDLDKVTQALRELKANAGLITASPDELQQAVAAGTVVIGVTASSYIGPMVEAGLPIDFTLPEEGAVGWGDTWTVSAGTDQEDLAYEWINLVTSEDFESKWAEDPGAGSPAPANQQASAALTEETKDRVQDYPEVLPRLALQGPLPDDQLEAWVAVWEEVKAG